MVVKSIGVMLGQWKKKWKVLEYTRVILGLYLGSMGITEKKMETTILGLYMYPISPFLGTLNSRCRIIMGTQKGTIILTTTDVGAPAFAFREEGLYFLRAQTSEVEATNPTNPKF